MKAKHKQMLIKTAGPFESCALEDAKFLALLDAMADLVYDNERRFRDAMAAEGAPITGPAEYIGTVEYIGDFGRDWAPTIHKLVNAKLADK